MARSRSKRSETSDPLPPLAAGDSTEANPSPSSSRASISIEDVLSPDVRDQIDHAHDRAAEEKAP